MPIEFILLGKSLFTEIALVWSVSLVYSLVILKVRTFDEAPVAEGALVRPDARHACIMIALALFVPKDLTTYGTLVFLRITWYYRYMTAVTMLNNFFYDHFIDRIFRMTLLERDKNVRRHINIYQWKIYCNLYSLTCGFCKLTE